MRLRDLLLMAALMAGLGLWLLMPALAGECAPDHPCADGECPTCSGSKCKCSEEEGGGCPNKCLDDKGKRTKCFTCDTDGDEINDKCAGEDGGCGGGKKGACGNPGGGNVPLGSLLVELELGKGGGPQGNSSAGRIEVRSDTPANDIFLAEKMTIIEGGDLLINYDLVDEVTPLLIQAPLCVVDVDQVTADHLELKFYDKANLLGQNPDGTGSFTNDPFVVWAFEQSASDTNTFFVREDFGATTNTHTFTWLSTSNVWTVARGGFEERKYEITLNATTKQEVYEWYVGSTQYAKKIDTYENLGWGDYVLVATLEDPNELELESTYLYVTTPTANGYKLVSREDHYDGSWITYQYEAAYRIEKKTEPWESGATVKETLYDYDWHITNDTTSGTSKDPRTVEVRIEGSTRSKTFYAYYTNALGERFVVEKVATHPAATWSSADNLVTTKTFFSLTNNAILARKLKSIQYPDGRLDSQTYEQGNYDAPTNEYATGTFTVNATGTFTRNFITHGDFSNANGIANKTTRDVTIWDQYLNKIEEEEQVYTGSGYSTAKHIRNTYDQFGRKTDTWYADGTKEETVWSFCCGKESTTSREGITTYYTYDILGYIATETKDAMGTEPDIVTTYTYDPKGNVISNKISAGSLSFSSTTEYDGAGRLKKTVDSSGLETTYAYTDNASGERVETVTLPGDATQITTYYLDGQVKSRTGTASVHQYVDYDYNGTLLSRTVRIAETNSPRVNVTKIDAAGRVVVTESPGYSGTLFTTNTFDTNGFLVARSQTDALDELFEYDEMGNQVRQGVDVNDDGSLVLASTDRISEQVTKYIETNGYWYILSKNLLYPSDNSTNSVIVRSSLRPVAGNGCSSCSGVGTKSSDVHGNETVSQTSIDAALRTVTRTVDYPDGSSNVVIEVNGLKTSETARSGITTIYNYDDLGRLTNQVVAGVQKTDYIYNTQGRLHIVKDHDENPTTYSYTTNSGRLFTTENAEGAKTYYKYNDRGQQTWVYGDAVYITKSVYNDYGEQTELHTFRYIDPAYFSDPGDISYPEQETPDITKWGYHEASGLLESKTDAASNTVSYTYTNDGKLDTRTWARGEVTSYEYTTLGELYKVDYTNGTTDIYYTYNRDGQVSSVDDAFGSRAFDYTDTLQLREEEIDGPNYANAAYGIEYDYASSGAVFGRSTGYTLSRGSYTNDVGYAYGNLGRLSQFNFTAEGQTGTVSYVFNTANGQAASQLYVLNDSTFMNVQNKYDALGRLTNKVSTITATNKVNISYEYNSIHQRARQVMTDKSYWDYEYDNKGQLIVGMRQAENANVIPGQFRSYDYDQIGNRLESRTARDNIEREELYVANELNQYTQRTVSAYVDAIGSVSTNAVVSVNENLALREGAYYHGEVAVDNSTNAVYNDTRVVATIAGAGAGGADLQKIKRLDKIVQQTPELFEYDADGNLTKDGRWIYTWNAENRLVAIESRNDITETIPKWKLEFDYDYRGRRFKKDVYEWDGTDWSLDDTVYFIYEGWNLVAEINSSGVYRRGYVWGLDLSGTPQGAGGVGGLLAIVDNGQDRIFVPTYDGNGNVLSVTDETDNSIVAEYEYDPFGNLIRETGSYAESNPFKFSTKYHDSETDLVYYGYRYLNTDTGRWISKDPYKENGGKNLYGFLLNAPSYLIDSLGRAPGESGGSDDCSDVCEKAGKDPRIHMHDRGGVVCCGGEKYTCVWKTGAKNKKAQEILKKCIAAHEDDHHDDIDCPKGCGITRPFFKWESRNKQRLSECEAYEVSYDCYEKAKSENKCEGDPECERELASSQRDADERRHECDGIPDYERNL